MGFGHIPSSLKGNPMDNDVQLPARQVRKKPFILFRIIQGVVAGFLGLLLLLTTSEFRKLGVPGAPVTNFWIAFALFGLLVIAHIPSVFFRMPKKAKVAAYVAMLVVLSTFGSYSTKMEPLWLRTPDGAKEAAQQAALDQAEQKSRAIEAEQVAKQEADRQRTEQVFAEAEDLGRQIKDLNKRQEGCFSMWGHQLPALTKAVKESLHDASSFEHVETVLIVPDINRNNVAMKFRAKNGFGGIRLAVVKAQLVADGCVVQNVGEAIVPD
jgi:hypothetical protein